MRHALHYTLLSTVGSKGIFMILIHVHTRKILYTTCIAHSMQGTHTMHIHIHTYTHHAHPTCDNDYMCAQICLSCLTTVALNSTDVKHSQ